MEDTEGRTVAEPATKASPERFVGWPRAALYVVLLFWLVASLATMVRLGCLRLRFPGCQSRGALGLGLRVSSAQAPFFGVGQGSTEPSSAPRPIGQDARASSGSSIGSRSGSIGERRLLGQIGQIVREIGQRVWSCNQIPITWDVRRFGWTLGRSILSLPAALIGRCCSLGALGESGLLPETTDLPVDQDSLDRAAILVLDCAGGNCQQHAFVTAALASHLPGVVQTTVLAGLGEPYLGKVPCLGRLPAVKGWRPGHAWALAATVPASDLDLSRLRYVFEEGAPHWFFGREIIDELGRPHMRLDRELTPRERKVLLTDVYYLDSWAEYGRESKRAPVNLPTSGHFDPHYPRYFRIGIVSRNKPVLATGERSMGRALR